MDTILSNSTLFSRPPLLPVRTVNITSSTSNLSPITSSFTSSTKKLFCLTSRTRRRRTTLWRWSRDNYSSTVTCGGGITEINETQFSDTVLKSDRPVLVEFVANWCGPCRLISPAMQWVAQEYSDRLTVVKIDHDANPKLIEEYKVYGLPSLILFKNGQEVPKSRMEGAITKVKLKEYVDALLESISSAA